MTAHIEAVTLWQIYNQLEEFFGMPFDGGTLRLTVHAQQPAYAEEATRFEVIIDGAPRSHSVIVAWAFGDGGYSLGEIVDHVYASPGTYGVGVKAINTSNGHAAFAELTISVGPARELASAQSG